MECMYLAPVLGPLNWYSTPTLDAALLCMVHREGVTTISSRAVTDLGRTFTVTYFNMFVINLIYLPILFSLINKKISYS